MVVAKVAPYDARPCTKSVVKTKSASRPAVCYKTYLLIFAGCLLLFGANAFLHGLVTVDLVRVAELTRQLEKAENLGREMELEIARLSSYQRIAEEAESRLAMHASGLYEVKFVAQAQPQVYSPAVIASVIPAPETGLMVALGQWMQSLGRAAAAGLP